MNIFTCQSDAEPNKAFSLKADVLTVILCKPHTKIRLSVLTFLKWKLKTL